MKKTGFLLLAAMSLASVDVAFAQVEYPTKAITAVNPYAPGGTLDLQSRAWASVVDKYLGKPVAVVNKAGATGMIGGTAGSQATPDGYTLTVGTTGLTCPIEWEIANGRKPPFTRHDFVTIGAFTMSPTLVIVPYESPWKTLGEMIRDIKAKPGFYAFSSAGLYGASHLHTQIFLNAAGLQCRHVPTAGGGPAVTAVVGKHVDFSNQYPPSTIPLIRGKKLRGLAVQSDRRLKGAPEIPTTRELGLEGAEFYTWVVILAPKKTPPAIVEKLREATKKTVEDKAFITTMESMGEEVRFLDGEGLAKYWDLESAKVAKIMAEFAREAAASKK